MRTFLFLLATGLSWLTSGCRAPDELPGSDAAVEARADAGEGVPDLELPDAATPGPDATAPAYQRGYVVVSRACFGPVADDCYGYATASFLAWSRWPPAGCVVSRVAGCEVEECRATAQDAGAEVPVEHSAGAIVIEGTQVAGGITLLPDAGYYFGTRSPLWRAGDALSITASGDAVPAFAATLTAPADIALTSPVCLHYDCGAVDRTKPLTLSWVGGGPASVYLVSTRTSGDEPVQRSASCRFASSPGLLPPSVLSLLGDSGAGFWNTLVVSPTAELETVAGGFEILMAIAGTATNGAGVLTTDCSGSCTSPRP